MTPYEEYKKGVEIYIADNKNAISETINQASKSLFPQHVLWAKTVCSELETETAKTLTIDQKFYFTEELVNRLMLYAYIKGEENIDINSYKRGWDDCRKDIANKLCFEE